MLHKKGNVVLDLRPSIGNPRNSEGAFLELKDGKLLFVYSRFIGDSSGDTGLACLAGRCSNDGGNTWSDDFIVATPEEHQAINIMSVSLLRMLNGDIGLFYLIRYGWHDTRIHLRRSADEGKSWGEPVCCIPGPGYYVTNHDRVVRLSNGRLIIPAAFHRMRGDSKTDLKSFDGKGVAYFFLSDDDGAAWREARSCCAMPVPRSISGLQEPGVIELNDGKLWAWCRTDMGYQYEMFSTDGGETWSVPVPSAFTSPCSPLSLKRMPDTGFLLAVWNPIPNYQTRMFERHTGGRTPLVGAISRNEGRTWGDFFAIEQEDGRGGYCYTAIHFSGDSVWLAYCAGEPEDGNRLSRLRIRKMMLSDILSP